MSDPVSLISSAVITRDELAAFLPAVGARAEPNGASVGRLSEGNSHVWIGIDNSPLEDYEQQELDVLTHLLGDIPRTLISLGDQSGVGKSTASSQVCLGGCSAMVLRRR